MHRKSNGSFRLRIDVHVVIEQFIVQAISFWRESKKTSILFNFQTARKFTKWHLKAIQRHQERNWGGVLIIKSRVENLISKNIFKPWMEKSLNDSSCVIYTLSTNHSKTNWPFRSFRFQKSTNWVLECISDKKSRLKKDIMRALCKGCTSQFHCESDGSIPIHPLQFIW